MTTEREWLLQEKYHGEKTKGFFADCARLEAGEPLAYLIGTTPFLHTTISLDSHPLIPRTETEFWVEKIIQEIHRAIRENLEESERTIRVLDLCAGSGCIGVAMLSEVPMSHVDFSEIDVRHHATIQKNIPLNNIDSTRTQIYGGDLFESITKTYDYILTNPPYIDPILDRATQSVKTFEPNLALYGGSNGTEIILKIIAQSASFLNVGGKLVIEHEPEQSEIISSHALLHGYHALTYQDQFGVKRYTVLIRK